MTRDERVRFKVLRRGGAFGYLYAKSDPTLTCNSKGEIKLSMRGDFLPVAFDAFGHQMSIDWLSDEIQPVLILDGEEHRLGVLSPATVTSHESETGDSVSVEAYDRCWIVRDSKLENILHLSKNAKYTDVIEQRLTACGISSVVTTPSTAVLTEDREDWGVGTSNLEIVNKLLSEINYKQLYFNSDGVAVLEPKVNPSSANLRHVLSIDKQNVRDPRSIGVIPLSLRVELQTDVYSAANVFVCTCANPDKSGVMTATAENANPQSPLSIMRRGRRIVDFENVSNIASQEELQKYVNQKRNKSMITGDVITCETLLYPGFGVEDITALHSSTVDDICVETGWEMQLKPGGRMKHTLERVVYSID